MTLINFKELCLDSETPLDLAVTTTVVSLILSVTSIVGNILIILAVVLDPNKNLRRPFSWLIVNLATADLISGAITNPTNVSFHFKICLGMKANDGEAIVLSTSFLISSTASALTIASLAFERYLSVRKANTYRNTVTNKRTLFIVVAIWMMSFASPIMYLKLGYVLSTFINVNAALLLATSVSCFMYFLMWRKLRERPQVNHNRITSHSVPSDFTSSNPATVSRKKMEEKVTRRFIVVLVVMLCCYGSSALFTYFLAVCESCSCVTLHWFIDLGFILVSINSCLNFFCYAMQSSRFRSVFIKILKIKKSRHYQNRSSSHAANNGEAAFFTRPVQQRETYSMI